jgi:tRNA(fMet)-specific endonuclease VapC
MSFLLDTNICSAHMRRPGGLAHRFIQHSGRIWISSTVLAELYAGAYKLDRPDKTLAAIHDLRKDVGMLLFDEECAETFGKLRGELRRAGIEVSPMDLMIAAAARVHDLTLVTHNTSDFRVIPGLRLVDWLT